MKLTATASSQWLEWWGESRLDGLADDQRSGQPPKLTATEQVQVLKIVKEEPRSTRRAVSEISRRLKKGRSADADPPAAAGTAEMEASAP